MPRISQLPSLSAADNADEIAIVDVSASTTKKITRGDLLKAPLPTNSVTTAAITDSAVTAAKIDFTTFTTLKSVDANGWTVYDHGGWKEYAITKYWTAGSPAAAAVVSTTVPYPVGLSASSIHSSSGATHVLSITTTGASAAELYNSVSSTRAMSGSIELFVKNIHSTAQAFGAVTSHVRIIAK